MSDKSFVEKVNVGNPSTGNKPISDYEFIRQYLTEGAYYISDSNAEGVLKDCMRYYKPDGNPFDLDGGRSKITHLLHCIPVKTKDEQYQKLIDALINAYAEYLAAYSEYYHTTQFEEFEAAKQKLYDAICELDSFHEKRRKSFKQAIIRDDYNKTVSAIKSIINQLPNEVPQGTTDEDYKHFAYATSSFKELAKHLDPAKTVINICSRNK